MTDAAMHPPSRPAGPRRARDRHQRIDPRPPRRRCAENMQPVADLHFLEVAEIGVERLQRLAGLARWSMPRSRSRPGAAARSPRSPGTRCSAPPRGRHRRRVAFVDQRLQRRERPMQLGAGHRRHQVVNDHRRRAPLGLRALAGIVDDEGIDQRRRPEAELRPAVRRQRQRLARQPFEIAVLAEMDDRVRGEGRRAATHRRRGSHAAARRSPSWRLAFVVAVEPRDGCTAQRRCRSAGR